MSCIFVFASHHLIIYYSNIHFLHIITHLFNILICTLLCTANRHSADQQEEALLTAFNAASRSESSYSISAVTCLRDLLGTCNFLLVLIHKIHLHNVTLCWSVNVRVSIPSFLLFANIYSNVLLLQVSYWTSLRLLYKAIITPIVTKLT